MGLVLEGDIVIMQTKALIVFNWRPVFWANFAWDFCCNSSTTELKEISFIADISEAV